MSAHTPGPWRVHSFSLTEHVIPEVWGLSGDEYSDHIKRVEDARLIAAAPELLDALERLVHRAMNELADPEDVPEIAAAVVAINKATGSTS